MREKGPNHTRWWSKKSRVILFEFGTFGISTLLSLGRSVTINFDKKLLANKFFEVCSGN